MPTNGWQRLASPPDSKRKKPRRRSTRALVFGSSSLIAGYSRTGPAPLVYVLAKDEGGRHTPIFGGYKPQFFFRTTNVTGEVGLSEGVEMVMPGDNATVHVYLEKRVAFDIGSRFAIREGGKTVGSGVVTEILA